MANYNQAANTVDAWHIFSKTLPSDKRDDAMLPFMEGCHAVIAIIMDRVLPPKDLKSRRKIIAIAELQLNFLERESQTK